jgi:hypothetical protein
MKKKKVNSTSNEENIAPRKVKSNYPQKRIRTLAVSPI